MWLVLAAVAVVAAHVHVPPPPGTGEFEPWIQRWLADRPRSDGGVDLRVSRGLGSKGYNKMRLSVVAQQPLTPSGISFTYNAKFKYRWTGNYLASTLIDLKPGLNNFTIGGQDVSVKLPVENQGTKGIIISDPCFSSKWVGCHYASEWDTFNKTTTILNAAMKHGDMDYWMILGDNFYDQSGELTQTFFDALTLDVKQKIVAVVMGNHDTWVCGSPGCGDMHDQWGNGMMQWYAQDTWGSGLRKDDVNFLNFDVDPDTAHTSPSHALNNATNLMWYNKIGNLGFIGYSGAYHPNDYEAGFKEACSYFATSKPAHIFLLGHWNGGGMGCEADMAVPEVYKRVLTYPGCDIGDRLKFQDGHTHCNEKQEGGAKEEVGFMIGGAGMSGCGQYGFEYMDSTNGRLKMVYFEVDNSKGTHNYDKLMACLAKGTLDTCVQELGTLWLDTAL